MADLKYNITVDLSDRNSSQALAANLIGRGRRVLDVGCATGYTGVVLKELDCEVVGIEIEAEAAAIARERLDEVFEFDIESTDPVEILDAATFDVVLFADVLEHVRDPLGVIRRFRPLLRTGGAVVASIPNVAHGALRLALLDGRFDYTDRGLLDATHLRFFTLSSIERLFENAGLGITDVERTRLPLDGTEIDVEIDSYTTDVLDRVMSSPEWDTYQFVIRAVPVVDDIVVHTTAKPSIAKRAFRRLPVRVRERLNHVLRRD